VPLARRTWWNPLDSSKPRRPCELGIYAEIQTGAIVGSICQGEGRGFESRLPLHQESLVSQFLGLPLKRFLPEATNSAHGQRGLTRYGATVNAEGNQISVGRGHLLREKCWASAMDTIVTPTRPQQRIQYFRCRDFRLASLNRSLTVLPSGAVRDPRKHGCL